MDDTHQSIDQKLDQLIESSAFTLKVVKNLVIITVATAGLVCMGWFYTIMTIYEQN